MVDISLESKLIEIDKEVNRVLGSQKNNILVVKTKEEFHNYITECINNNIVAIDTETNNSLDPVTCKIMGLCLYTYNQKQAYIPINHRNPKTKERLTFQLTEHDIYDELKRIVDSKVFIVMHNGKFDYEVIKCTCKIALPINWDTIIAAKLLNENEQSFSLKNLYIKYVDKNQESYKIDKLFKGVQYSDVDPNTFGIYSATDSLMTLKLYDVQKELMNKEPGIKKLFDDVEMPVVPIVAEMELYGTDVDLRYCSKLKNKYDSILKDIIKKIDKNLDELEPIISRWRNSNESQEPEVIYISKNELNKLEYNKMVKKYPNLDIRKNLRYKFGKKKCDILNKKIKITSNKQFPILMYDVLGSKQFDKDKPQSTSSSVLEDLEIYFKETKEYIENMFISIKTECKNKSIDISDSNLRDIFDKFQALESDSKDDLEFEKEFKNLLKILNQHRFIFLDLFEEHIKDDLKYIDIIIDFIKNVLDKRKTEKLISSYLKNVPLLSKHWPDGKIRFHIDSLGARTGRFTSGGEWKYLEDGEPKKISGLNSQNLPAKNHEIRLMFKASEGRVFVGGDWSQQEPKLAAHISRDKKMRATFKEGKDIYATIAQSIFDNNYEDNLEYFDVEKTKINLEGKDRRSVGKKIILATLYGMGPSTVGKNINKSKEEAQFILDKFFEDFTGVKSAIENSKELGRINGFVEGLYFRKRRLPDLSLRKYKAKFIFKPNMSKKDCDKLLEYYINKASNNDKSFMNDEDFKLLKEEASKNGIEIISNEEKIMKAERQCFNSLIQGSGATMAKWTMVLVNNDKILKDCDAHLVFQIHDELIMDCPIEHAETVSNRLKYIMLNSINKIGVTIPMKCDMVIEKRWGEDTMSEELREEYQRIIKKTDSKDPLEDLCNEFPNFPADSIKEVVTDETAQTIIKFD